MGKASDLGSVLDLFFLAQTVVYLLNEHCFMQVKPKFFVGFVKQSLWLR